MVGSAAEASDQAWSREALVGFGRSADPRAHRRSDNVVTERKPLADVVAVPI